MSGCGLPNCDNEGVVEVMAVAELVETRNVFVFENGMPRDKIQGPQGVKLRLCSDHKILLFGQGETPVEEVKDGDAD